MDLFPETLGKAPTPIEYVSPDMLCKWGHPRVTVRLIPSWDEKSGLWYVGWLCMLDKAVDEHLPTKVTPSGYPWYRPGEFPYSKDLDVAKGIAGRAVKIVMEQMLGYVAPDIVPAARLVQDTIEKDAQRWFGVGHN